MLRIFTSQQVKENKWKRPSITISKFRQSTDFGGLLHQMPNQKRGNQSKGGIHKWGLKWLKLKFSPFIKFTHYITYIKCLVAIVCHKNDFGIFALQTIVGHPVCTLKCSRPSRQTSRNNLTRTLQRQDHRTSLKNKLLAYPPRHGKRG